jgi:hypothetical protein
MAQTQDTLTIEVDRGLATEYRIAYEQAFGINERPLAAFITSFVNDRLAEELKFVQVDYARENR